MHVRFLSRIVLNENCNRLKTYSHTMPLNSKLWTRESSKSKELVQPAPVAARREAVMGVVGTGLSSPGSIWRTIVIIWTKASLVPKWLSDNPFCCNLDQLFFQNTTGGKEEAVKDLRCSSPAAGPSYRYSWRSEHCKSLGLVTLGCFSPWGGTRIMGKE